ncbi:T9SS type A sorting domain-containing protein [Winogradskyella sp.]|uniref:T9SS type A sorting domain-containing protein n=1 Tax=Winogradskyella sp. TaxID=1883156 RepID=UPI003BAA7E29
MKCLSFLITLVVCFSLKAQITSAEYFIDTDPGVGNGLAIAVSGNAIDQELNVPTTGLSDGVHKLYIRVQNSDGNWSLYANNVFYINPNNDNSANIAAAEYFIDTDPGVGNGVGLTVSGNVIDQSFDIPTTGLMDGVHKLYVRVINDDGSWSLYDKNVFYANPNNENTAAIVSGEYFMDTDPGVGNGISLTVSGNTVDQNFSIPTTGILDGVHKLYVRLFNADGSWSLYDTNVFYANPNNENSASIVSAEYFIDTDPGPSNANPLTISGNAIDQNINIPTTGLADGVHKLYVRLHNADGSWSLYDKAVFYLSADLSNTAFLSEAEYFIDIDPGIGNGTPITFSETEVLDSDFEIDVPNDLPVGDHIVYVRVRNTQGVWSLHAYSGPSTLSTTENPLRDFKMYPIPVRDVLTFETNNQRIENIMIIDLNGKVVLDVIPEGFNIDLSDLNAGTYLIYLKTIVGSISKKLVKQ